MQYSAVPQTCSAQLKPIWSIHYTCSCRSRDVWGERATRDETHDSRPQGPSRKPPPSATRPHHASWQRHARVPKIRSTCARPTCTSSGVQLQPWIGPGASTEGLKAPDVVRHAHTPARPPAPPPSPHCGKHAHRGRRKMARIVGIRGCTPILKRCVSAPHLSTAWGLSPPAPPCECSDTLWPAAEGSDDADPLALRHREDLLVAQRVARRVDDADLVEVLHKFGPYRRSLRLFVL